MRPIGVSSFHMAKHSSSILALARRGAESRWHELQAELADLLKAFPDLATLRRETRAIASRGGRAVRAAAKELAAPAPARHRRKMSPAARRAVSQRMKKYWAARRKEKKS